MRRRDVVGPLVVLQPVHALEGEHVRPGAVEPRRLVRAVIVHEQMPRRRLTRDAIVVVHHRLIVALHEVHLDPLHAPALELVEGGLHLRVQRAPGRPEDDPDVLRRAVLHERRDVDPRRLRHEIAELVPALVEDDVGDAVLRREVDVVAVRLVVHAGAEGHAAQVEVVVPVPGHLARPDPRHVGESRRCREEIHHLVEQQLPVVVGDHHDAPRQRAATTRARQPVGAARHGNVAVVARPLLERGARERSHQAAFGARDEVHARVVLELRFRDGDPGPASNAHERGEQGMPPADERVEADAAIDGLLMRHERRVDAHDRLRLSRDGERRLLRAHDGAVADVQHPAIRDTLIVGAKLEVVIAEPEPQLVEAIGHDGALHRRDRPHAVAHLPAGLGANRGPDAERAAVAEREGDGRGGENGSAAPGHRVRHAGAHVDGEHGGPVGRLDAELTRLLGASRPEGKQRSEQGDGRNDVQTGHHQAGFGGGAARVAGGAIAAKLGRAPRWRQVTCLS